jgi:hypothetical protein
VSGPRLDARRLPGRRAKSGLQSHLDWLLLTNGRAKLVRAAILFVALVALMLLVGERPHH